MKSLLIETNLFEGKVNEALELPKPGTGIYTIDMGDPAATNTWPPTRMEFNMKDENIRNTIIETRDDVKKLEERMIRMEDKIDALK